LLNYLNAKGRLGRYRREVNVGRENVRISYLDIPGPGLPVVFIHGAFGCAVQWEVQAERLSRRHRVLVLDMRGHGHSDKPETTYRTEDFIEDLIAWSDAVHLPEEFYLVGHSFGGYVATLLALHFGTRIRKLVLMNTTGNLRHLDTALSLASTLPGTIFQAVHRAIPVLMSAPPHVMRRFMTQALTEWECWDLYEGIHCPTLVITGRFDHIAPPSHAQRIVSRLPHGRLQVYGLSRHMTMLEQAGSVADALEAFFKGTWPAGGGPVAKLPLRTGQLVS